MSDVVQESAIVVACAGVDMSCTSVTATGTNCAGVTIESTGVFGLVGSSRDSNCVSQKAELVVKCALDEDVQFSESVTINGEVWKVDSVEPGQNCCLKLFSHMLSRVSIPCTKTIDIGEHATQRDGCDDICGYVFKFGIEGNVFKHGFAEVQNGNDYYPERRYRLYSNELARLCECEARVYVECDGRAYSVMGVDLEAECPYATLRDTKLERLS